MRLVIRRFVVVISLQRPQVQEISVDGIDRRLVVRWLLGRLRILKSCVAIRTCAIRTILVVQVVGSTVDGVMILVRIAPAGDLLIVLFEEVARISSGQGNL